MGQNTYTIFWAHPYHGEGCFTLETSNSPEQVAEEAANMLAWDFVDDHEDELEIATILDDIDVEVYAGKCLFKPLSAPLAIFE